MTSVVQIFGGHIGWSRALPIPEFNASSMADTLAIERLPTEPIGAFSLTLTNLVIGGAIQIETQAGTVIENRDADAATEVFSIPAYVAGNANNDLRIKVRKGSDSPYYIPWETRAVGFVGAQSIYVSQIPDE